MKKRVAALIASVALVALASPARAEESDNLWKKWWDALGYRESKAELVIVVIASFPAMAVTTPMWLAKMGYQKLSSED